MWLNKCIYKVPCLAESLQCSDQTAVCSYGHYFQKDKLDVIYYRKDGAQVKMDKAFQTKVHSCLRVCPQQQPTVNAQSHTLTVC